jgi:DDE family transposase
MAFEITKASESDYKHLLPLLEDLKKNAPDIHKTIEMILADRGYDSAKIKKNLDLKQLTHILFIYKLLERK